MKAFENQVVERSGSVPVQLSEIEYCVRIIEQLREENALLRSSAIMFGELAERLNAALSRERGIGRTAPGDRAAEDSLG
jgi:hypothetical protein